MDQNESEISTYFEISISKSFTKQPQDCRAYKNTNDNDACPSQSCFTSLRSFQSAGTHSCPLFGG